MTQSHWPDDYLTPNLGGGEQKSTGNLTIRLKPCRVNGKLNNKLIFMCSCKIKFRVYEALLSPHSHSHELSRALTPIKEALHPHISCSSFTFIYQLQRNAWPNTWQITIQLKRYEIIQLRAGLHVNGSRMTAPLKPSCGVQKSRLDFKIVSWLPR